jgi:hypothetical protein
MNYDMDRLGRMLTVNGHMTTINSKLVYPCLKKKKATKQFCLVAPGYRIDDF